MIEPRLLKLITGLTNLFFGLVLVFLIGYIIYLGINYIVNAEKGAKKLQESVLLILIGIVLIFLSRLIPRLIEMFFQ